MAAAGADLPRPAPRGRSPSPSPTRTPAPKPAVGFFLETLAGAALLAAGGALLVLSGRSPRKAVADREDERERCRAEESLWDTTPPAGGGRSAA